MIAQQNYLDVIANNVANVNTTAFKQSRIEFQDLLSQATRTPGALMNQGTYQPVGIEIGLGVKTAATTRVFTQGVADGLGITEPVNSPTFTIVQIYESGRLPFYHFDVYRIADVEEMEAIGYEDCFYGEGICLIEWAELIQEILPKDCISIRIEKDLSRGFDYRRITIEPAK